MGGSGGKGGSDAQAGSEGGGMPAEQGGEGGGDSAETAPFSISVEPAALALARGASAELTVHVERDPGFEDAVRLTLDELPEGFAADVVTLPFGVDDGVLTLVSTPELSEGSDFELTALGTSGKASASAELALSVAPEELSSREKIQAALVAGDIDRETSLLYRMYALFGDARLPEALLGSGSDEEDAALFGEIWLTRSELSSGGQAALRPFLVRPAHPESVWNEGVGTPRRFGAAPVAAAELPPAADCPEQSGAPGAWMSRRSAAEPVRVWAQCRGTPEGDAETVRLVDKALGVLHKIYGPMTGLMTAPIADEDGGDEAIDFYIVDPGASVHRREESFAPVALGSTYDDYPEVNSGSSGFVTLPRSLVYTSRFHSTVIHEFFHVLEKAYNHLYSVRELTPPSYVAHWFPEAAAVWAAAHFDRVLAPWEDGRGAYLDAHLRFVNRFQPSESALNASEPVPHAYSAYIWPFFVEQETGAPTFMPQIWEGLVNAGSFEQADDAIASVFPFAEHFKDFALRNANSAFLPGDPLPKSQRYVALDPIFPDGQGPKFLQGELVADQEFRRELPIPNLAARYLLVSADADTKKVELDLSGLQPAGQVDVQALVYNNVGGWVPEPLDFSDESRVVFCFDKGKTTPERYGSFGGMLLVISNHATRDDSSVSGELVISPKSEPCTPVWQGAVSMTQHYPSPAGEVTNTVTTDVTFEFDDTAPASPFQTLYRVRGGTYAYDWLGDFSERTPDPCQTHQTASGSMNPDPAAFVSGTPGASMGNITIDLLSDPPTYSAQAYTYANAHVSSDCNDAHEIEEYDYVTVLSWWTTDPVIWPEVSEDGNVLAGTYETTVDDTTTKFVWNLVRVDE